MRIAVTFEISPAIMKFMLHSSLGLAYLKGGNYIYIIAY